MSLEDARRETARGWRVIPVPPREKAPTLREWQALRLELSDLPQYFNGQPTNLGVLLGEPSGDLVDIDLDAAETVALADVFLPTTRSVFGRAGKPRSHRLYVCAIETAKFVDADGTMLVEIRSTGMQTVVPPSTHPSGEAIAWSEDGEPAHVDADELRHAVAYLASAATLARHWPGEGARHEAALAAAGFLARAGIGDEPVVRIVTAAARMAGDDEARRREALDTVAAIRGGEPVTGGPRLAELVAGAGAKVVERMRKWLGVSTEDRALYNLTDAGNAQRFTRDHGRDLRYCYAWCTWLVWDGRRWAKDAGDAIMVRAKETARRIFSEAAAEPDGDRRRAIAAWAKKTESRERLLAMLALAQSEPGIPITPDELDRDAFALNVENGTLDLRTGELRPHRRADRITKLAGTTFDGGATCPLFFEFLERIAAGDAERIAFLQRALGYSLTGDTREQCFFLAWGSGANGKTTLLRVVFALLGDYAAGTPASTFMVRHHESIPNDLARLAGSRYVLASEGEENQRLAESLVKGVTGGDVLTARFMRSEFFDFTPVLKLWIGTNHRPVIRGTDRAIWRRVKLIAFDVTIPEPDRDKTLGEKLLAEAPAILAWLVAGCRQWLARGLDVPPSVRDATGEYRAEMDVLGGFLEDRCMLDAAAVTSTRELYEDYQQWCAAASEKPVTKKTFGLRLAERGYAPDRTRQERGWRGLRLRSPLEAVAPESDPTAAGVADPW